MAVDFCTPATENVSWGAGASPSAVSITIPSDCELILVLFSYFGGTGNLGALTLDGVDVPKYAWIQPTATELAIGVGWYGVPPTGAQDLQIAWGNTPTNGPLTTCVYLKGCNRRSMRDFDTDRNAGTGAVSVDVRAASTDVVIFYDVTTDAGEAPPASVGGMTSLTTQGVTDLASRTSWRNGLGIDVTDNLDCQGDSVRAGGLGIVIPQAGPYLRHYLDSSSSGTAPFGGSLPVWAQNDDLVVIGLKTEVADGSWAMDDAQLLVTTYSAVTAEQAHTNGDLWEQMYFGIVDAQDDTGQIQSAAWRPFNGSWSNTDAAANFIRSNAAFFALDVGMEWDLSPLSSVGATNEAGTAITAGTVSGITKPCVALTVVAEYSSKTTTPGTGWTEMIDNNIFSQYRIEATAPGSLTGDCTASDTAASLAHMVVFQINLDVEGDPFNIPGQRIYVLP